MDFKIHKQMKEVKDLDVPESGRRSGQVFISGEGSIEASGKRT
jgi:hypothetical protein